MCRMIHVRGRRRGTGRRPGPPPGSAQGGDLAHEVLVLGHVLLGLGVGLSVEKILRTGNGSRRRRRAGRSGVEGGGEPEACASRTPGAPGPPGASRAGRRSRRCPSWLAQVFVHGFPLRVPVRAARRSTVQRGHHVRRVTFPHRRVGREDGVGAATWAGDSFTSRPRRSPPGTCAAWCRGSARCPRRGPFPGQGELAGVQPASARAPSPGSTRARFLAKFPPWKRG